MKTTNLFVDFLIIGVLAFLALAGTCYFAGMPELLEFGLISTKDRALLLPLGTVSIYVVGILSNQLADSILKQLRRPLFLTAIDEAEVNLHNEIGVLYHEALQKIVRESQSAYDYLSYRRSMIRVFRSITALGFLSSISCLILAVMHNILAGTVSWIAVAIFVSATLVLGVFGRQRLIKLQIGYYSAIINFYKTEKQQ